MAEFNIRADAVDVEQIMKQIRARIQEKRGVDYTEDQIRELATVRLEKFLDPKNLRSDLLEQFRRSRPAIPGEPPPVEPPYRFDDETLFASHRAVLRIVRRLLRPVLKLFFNPNTLNQILHTQAQFNVDLLKREQRRKIEFDRSRAEWNALYYEVLHNLVLETTRTGIELKNLKMRLEALTSRLDFSERRVRALEGVVQYRPEAFRPRERDRGERGTPRPGASGEPVDTAAGEATPAEGGSNAGGEAARRRRRRRRGRRGLTGAEAGSTGEATGTEAADEMTGHPEESRADAAPEAGEAAASDDAAEARTTGVPDDRSRSEDEQP